MRGRIGLRLVVGNLPVWGLGGGWEGGGIPSHVRGERGEGWRGDLGSFWKRDWWSL